MLNLGVLLFQFLNQTCYHADMPSQWQQLELMLLIPHLSTCRGFVLAFEGFKPL